MTVCVFCFDIKTVMDDIKVTRAHVCFNTFNPRAYRGGGGGGGGGGCHRIP